MNFSYSKTVTEQIAVSTAYGFRKYVLAPVFVTDKELKGFEYVTVKLKWKYMVVYNTCHYMAKVLQSQITLPITLNFIYSVSIIYHS